MARRRYSQRPIPKDPITATIERLSHDGRGVTHVDGKTTFVWGALPDEKIRFTYTKTHSSYDEAQIEELIEPSPLRAEPRCPHFGVCGGCSLQHLKPEAQREYKQRSFLELLAHQAHTQPLEILEPLSAGNWGYRRKARIGVKYLIPRSKVLVGFRERNGHYIADLNRCEVLHPSIGEKLSLFSEFIDQLSIKEEISQLEVAVSDHESAIIMRHLKPFSEADLELCHEFAKFHRIKLYLQPHGTESIHLLEPQAADPLLEYSLPAYKINLKFHPAQFTQINSEINQKMIEKALELLDIQNTERVLDLFCGIGNFSLPMARLAKKVIGVEGDASAVLQAESNAVLNQIHNTEFHTANLFSDLSQASWAQESYDKVLLDPPRTGAIELMDYLPHWNAKKIVYISCNPSTLARDTQKILAQGYTLQSAGIMDMFPHTQHVEAIALFEWG